MRGKSHVEERGTTGKSLGGENAGSSGFLDLLFRFATEEFGFHDERDLGQMTLAKDLQG